DEVALTIRSVANLALPQRLRDAAAAYRCAAGSRVAWRSESVAQDSRLACARLALARELRRHPDPAGKQVNLGLVCQAGLLDPSQPRVPSLRMVRVLETGIAALASDVLEHLLRVQLDRELADPADAAVVVERDFARAEVLGDPAENADDHRFGQEGEQ